MADQVVRRIWVVGSASDDLMVLLPILPGPGESVTGGSIRAGLGGKGANQAVAAARLGGTVAFIGAVGDDDSGHLVRRELEAAGVDATRLAVARLPTSRALGMVAASSGQNLWGIDSGANLAITPEAAAAGLKDARPLDVVTAVNEIPADSVAAAATVARATGCRFVLNAAPGRVLPPEVAALCDVVIVNEVEIQQLGYRGPEGLLAAGVQAVVVTLGRDGAAAYEVPGPVDRIPALEVAIADTTGAGDAFVGAYAVALAEGRDRATALRWGVTAGSLACRAMGARASQPNRDELVAYLDGRDHTRALR